MSRRLFAIAALACAALGAQAQGYPVKPMRMVIPLPPALLVTEPPRAANDYAGAAWLARRMAVTVTPSPAACRTTAAISGTAFASGRRRTSSPTCSSRWLRAADGLLGRAVHHHGLTRVDVLLET